MDRMGSAGTRPQEGCLPQLPGPYPQYPITIDHPAITNPKNQHHVYAMDPISCTNPYTTYRQSHGDGRPHPKGTGTHQQPGKHASVYRRLPEQHRRRIQGGRSGHLLGSGWDRRVSAVGQPDGGFRCKLEGIYQAARMICGQRRFQKEHITIFSDNQAAVR
jgi:hypothetical protein